MKKLIYFAYMLAGLFVMTSCEKDEIGGTSTEALAGEWYVTADQVDENGNLVYEDLYGVGRFLINTYNTAANTGSEIWVDDNNHFWQFKVKASADIKNLTFQTNGAVANTRYEGCDVTIEGGKVIPGGATTPHGTPADSIVFYVSFSDDEYAEDYGYAKFKISGYRYTGLAEDD